MHLRCSNYIQGIRLGTEVVSNIALGQRVLVGYYNEIINNNEKPFTKYYGIDFGPSAPRRLRHNPDSAHGLAHSTFVLAYLSPITLTNIRGIDVQLFYTSSVSLPTCSK